MFVAAERERKISRSSNIRNNNIRASLYHEKCLPDIVSKKIQPKVIAKERQLQLNHHHPILSKQIEYDRLNSTVVECEISKGVDLPPLKTDSIRSSPRGNPNNIPIKSKSSNCASNESYFVPILVPKSGINGVCKSIATSLSVNSNINCCKENKCVFPVKPKPQRLLPLMRQKALEDHSTLIIHLKGSSNSPVVESLSSNHTVDSRVCLVDPYTANRHRTSNPKKSLRGEFTHFPSFWNIFPAKPSPTILPPLAGFFQSIPNKSSRRTNKMATSPTLDQTVPTMITPTVLINHDLLTNGDEDSQEGLSPVLVPTVVSRPPFVHTVSIVVEPVTDMCDGSSMDEPDTDEFSSTEIDDDLAGKSVAHEDLVKTVMDHARLRKEEFARLLEEHAQIVSEINKAENKMV